MLEFCKSQLQVRNWAWRLLATSPCLSEGHGCPVTALAIGGGSLGVQPWWFVWTAAAVEWDLETPHYVAHMHVCHGALERTMPGSSAAWSNCSTFTNLVCKYARGLRQQTLGWPAVAPEEVQPRPRLCEMSGQLEPWNGNGKRPGALDTCMLVMGP